MIKYRKINDQQIYRETVIDTVSFSPIIRFFVLDEDTKTYFKCQYALSTNQEPFSESGELAQELEKVLIRELTLELENFAMTNGSKDMLNQSLRGGDNETSI